MGNVAAVVAGAAHRLGGHIRAVGFQQGAVARDGGQHLGGALGPLIGHCPAKAQIQPLLNQPNRVLGAAAVAVQCAARLIFAQQLVHFGVGLAVVDRHRQIQLFRKL